jgi:hypothetical protein
MSRNSNQKLAPLPPLPDAAIEEAVELSARNRPLKAVSRAESASRTALAEVLLTKGYGEAVIIQALEKKFSCTKNKARQIIASVRSKWLQDYETERPIWKAAAIRRVTTHIQTLMKGEVPTGKAAEYLPKDDKGNPIPVIDYPTLLGFERLLSDLQGTKAPVEVKATVSVNEAMVNVIGNLSPEQQEAMLHEYEQMRQLAERAAAQLPPPANAPAQTVRKSSAAE